MLRPISSIMKSGTVYFLFLLFETWSLVACHWFSCHFLPSQTHALYGVYILLILIPELVYSWSIYCLYNVTWLFGRKPKQVNTNTAEISTDWPICGYAESGNGGCSLAVLFSLWPADYSTSSKPALQWLAMVISIECQFWHWIRWCLICG